MPAANGDLTDSPAGSNIGSAAEARLERSPLELALRTDAFLFAGFFSVGVFLLIWFAASHVSLRYDPPSAQYFGEDRRTYIARLVLFFGAGSAVIPLLGLIVGVLLYLIYGLFRYAYSNAWPPSSHYWHCVVAFNLIAFCLGTFLLSRLVWTPPTVRDWDEEGPTSGTAPQTGGSVSIFGAFGLLIQVFGFCFTVRDIWQLVSG